MSEWRLQLGKGAGRVWRRRGEEVAAHLRGPGKVVHAEGQGVGGGLVACQHEGESLGGDLVVVEGRLAGGRQAAEEAANRWVVPAWGSSRGGAGEGQGLSCQRVDCCFRLLQPQKCSGWRASPAGIQRLPPSSVLTFICLGSMSSKRRTLAKIRNTGSIQGIEKAKRSNGFLAAAAGPPWLRTRGQHRRRLRCEALRGLLLRG